MKRLALTLLITITVSIGIGMAYLYTAFPNVLPAPDIVVEGTKQQLERGKYLAEHVTLCMDCHSERNWGKYSGPITPGTYGKGGDRFDENMGFPGTFYAKNITPHKLESWTDGEIYRAITTGVSKDGSPLFPVMPYLSYGKMDTDDVKAIIAYLRTIDPIEFEPPKSSPNFPMNIILRTIPQEADPMDHSAFNSPVERGRYLTTIAACTDCHTPKNKGAMIDSMMLAGGFEFKMPFGTVRSANITPHKENGIGNWSKEKFVNRFKQFDGPADSLADVSSDQFNTIMPWNMYAGMKQEDLEAIYEYLMSIPPISNSVVRFTPAEKSFTSRQ